MRNPVKTAKRQLLRVGSCALSALMVLGSIPAAAIGDGVTATYDEAYYAMTDYYGNLTDGSVVKSYRTNGIATLTDYGDYDEIINLTDGTVPARNGGMTTFRLDEKALPGTFYFEGKTTKPFQQLPWTISMSYTLNGVPTKAEDLVGQAGVVEIRLDIVPNERASEYARNNYTLEAMAIFNQDDILSLEAPGAQVQLIGNLRAVLFLGLPGEECHYTIRVGSEDFAFGGMTFLMVPATLSQLEEIAKLSERKDDLEDNYNKLSGSIDSLLDAMTAMTGSLNASANGLEQLNKARGIFSDGKGVIYSGTDALREDLSNLMAVYEKLGFLVDEQVIREYIHHADVAEDVAAYLDLYRKYQDDYGIPQILDGCVRPEIYARIYAAAFDERLSVVHLLLDGLAAFFGRAASERALTDAWYAFLKEYRSQVETAGDPAECYRTLVAEREQEMLRQIANDAYTREEAKREKLLLEKLKAAQQEVTKDSAQRCFEAAKVGFDRQRVLFPFGWGELWGIADRTDYDLTQHQNHSGKSLEYLDPVTNERYIPYCIEPSLGVDRMVLAFLCNAYEEQELEGGDVRTVLHLHPALAPYKAAVLPLQKNKLGTLASEIHADLAKYFPVDYDETGSIGKRYRRQDEIGTPFTICVDFDTEATQSVTVRDRDTMLQERVALKDLRSYIEERMRF